ncbi:MAG: hypothetical protein KC657_22105 [Myxococcales bacterium]|nr:hypothetical protein [Myxococcales bacterium]
MSLPAPRAHPLAGIARRYSRAAVALGALGLLGALAGSYATTAACGVLGALFYAYARLLRRSAGAVPRVNAAFELLSRGRTKDALAALDAIDARTETSPYVRRAIAMQRALIAMHDGDTDAAKAFATDATQGQAQWVTRVAEQRAIATAHGLLAVVLAARGEDDASEASSRAAESAPDAAPDALARAELARCIRHARAGRLLELASSFEQKGGLMLEHVLPRERALVRALRKMARSRPTSVYREPQRPDDAPPEQTALTGLIASVVPEAARFAASPRPLAATADRAAPAVVKRRALAAIADDRRRAAKATPSRAPRIALATAIAAALVGGVVVAWPDASGDVAEGGLGGLQTVLALSVVAVVGIAGVRFTRAVSAAHAIQRLSVPIALRQYDVALPALERAARGGLDQISAMAHLQLGSIALRRARFAEARAAFDAGIARATRSAVVKAASSDLLLPQLIAGRAYALALMGKADEASAELAVLDESFPSFAYAATARLRVDLATALVARDLETAATLAATRTPELPLGLHEDLLADVSTAIAHPPRTDADRDERERVARELRDDEEVAAFVEAILPGVRDELGRDGDGRSAGATRARVALHTRDDDREDEARGDDGGDEDTDADSPGSEPGTRAARVVR